MPGHATKQIVTDHPTNGSVRHAGGLYEVCRRHKFGTALVTGPCSKRQALRYVSEASDRSLYLRKVR